jgi:hypothetical protein
MGAMGAAGRAVAVAGRAGGRPLGVAAQAAGAAGSAGEVVAVAALAQREVPVTPGQHRAVEAAIGRVHQAGLVEGRVAVGQASVDHPGGEQRQEVGQRRVDPIARLGQDRQET